MMMITIQSLLVSTNSLKPSEGLDPASRYVPSLEARGYQRGTAAALGQGLGG